MGNVDDPGRVMPTLLPSVEKAACFLENRRPFLGHMNSIDFLTAIGKNVEYTAPNRQR